MVKATAWLITSILLSMNILSITPNKNDKQPIITMIKPDVDVTDVFPSGFDVISPKDHFLMSPIFIICVFNYKYLKFALMNIFSYYYNKKKIKYTKT